MNYIYIILIYLIFITITAVVITVHDKNAAVEGRRRVPENTLMTVGLIGGALPMLITMKIIRHKTKHIKFMLGLPLEILLQAAIIIAAVYLRNR